MVWVAIGVAAHDNCDARVSCAITSVTSNQRIDADDFRSPGHRQAPGRAVGSPKGPRLYGGRRVPDGAGNRSTSAVTVTVLTITEGSDDDDEREDDRRVERGERGRE